MRKSRPGNYVDYVFKGYTVFDIVRDESVDLSLLEIYIDAGMDVNCAESSWRYYHNGRDSEDKHDKDEKHHQTLLHAAIICSHVEVVKLLIQKGADVNQNMCFTHKGRFYLISCL